MSYKLLKYKSFIDSLRMGWRTSFSDLDLQNERMPPRKDASSEVGFCDCFALQSSVAGQPCGWPSQDQQLSCILLLRDKVFQFYQIILPLAVERRDAESLFKSPTDICSFTSGLFFFCTHSSFRSPSSDQAHGCLQRTEGRVGQSENQWQMIALMWASNKAVEMLRG